MDLWKIISIEWSEFASILGEDKSIWGMRFTKIAKVRTPMAHNRELLISKTDRQEAESYCGKILERMKFQP
jgi:hypothetical protein